MLMSTTARPTVIGEHATAATATPRTAAVIQSPGRRRGLKGFEVIEGSVNARASTNLSPGYAPTGERAMLGSPRNEGKSKLVSDPVYLDCNASTPVLPR